MSRLDEAYHTDWLEQHGQTYRVDYFYDHDMGEPWAVHEGHGVVSEWTIRTKRPGELILSEDRGYKRFYDVPASMQKAIAEGWDAEPYGKGSKRQQATRAVMADYERMRAWCNDEWHWCGVVITEIREDADGCKYDGESAGLWGLESDHVDTGALYQDLIGEIEYTNNHLGSNA